MAPYFIDGKEAQGEDYAEALEALPSAEDHPAEVCIETPNNRTLMVCNWPGGRFLVIDKRPDGSEWRSQPLGREQVRAVVVSFLNGEEWRKGLQWELEGLAAEDNRRGMLVILLVAVLIIGVVLWHSGPFNSGVSTPPPPQQAVGPKDVVGTWHYRGAAPGTVCEINLNADETYSVIHRRSSTASTNTGRWALEPRDLPPSLVLYPFYTSSSSERGAIDRSQGIRWWVTSASSNPVAPFGGDSVDPRRWAVLSRAKVEPVPARDWPGMVAALTIVVCMSAGLLWWKARTKPRAGKWEWSSGLSVASAVLPRIERLRADHLSSAPIPVYHTPAHKRLVAMARRFVAQFAYFRKPENPDPAAPHETRDRTT
jgi:hypothetical protein